MTPALWCFGSPRSPGILGNAAARLAEPLAASLAVLACLLFACPARAQQPKKICIVLNRPWTQTGVMLNQGQTFTVTASGDMNWFTPIPSRGWRGCAPGNYCHTSPDGAACPFPGFPAQGLACWSLIGRVGNGPIFRVGTSLKNFTAPSSGELLLGVNDTPNDYFDNTGQWQAEIATGGWLGGMTPALPCVPPSGHDVQCIRLYPQKQPNWCWAAVTEILMQNAGLGSEYHRQCEQVAAKLQKPVEAVCGTIGDDGFDEHRSTPWDTGGDPLQSLNNFQFGFSQEGAPSSIPLVESVWGTFTTSFIKQEIGCADRPIGVTWSQNALSFNPAHAMVIMGYATNPGNGTLELHVFNPGIHGLPTPGATPNQGSSSPGQKAPPTPAVVCMYSATCTISFENFVTPAPYTLSEIVYNVHKLQ